MLEGGDNPYDETNTQAAYNESSEITVDENNGNDENNNEVTYDNNETAYDNNEVTYDNTAESKNEETFAESKYEGGENKTEDEGKYEEKSEEWSLLADEQGNQYYYNNFTGESQWEQPEGFS